MEYNILITIDDGDCEYDDELEITTTKSQEEIMELITKALASL